MIPPIVGVAEAAEMIGVTKQRVVQLRGERTFPRPVVVLRATPVWLRADIEGWIAGFRPPRTDGRILINGVWNYPSPAASQTTAPEGP